MANEITEYVSSSAFGSVGISRTKGAGVALRAFGTGHSPKRFDAIVRCKPLRAHDLATTRTRNRRAISDDARWLIAVRYGRVDRAGKRLFPAVDYFKGRRNFFVFAKIRFVAFFSVLDVRYVLSQVVVESRDARSDHCSSTRTETPDNRKYFGKRLGSAGHRTSRNRKNIPISRNDGSIGSPPDYRPPTIIAVDGRTRFSVFTAKVVSVCQQRLCSDTTLEGGGSL